MSLAECHYAECHYAEFHYAESYYAECHYAECHYAECRGANISTFAVCCYKIKLTQPLLALREGVVSNSHNDYPCGK